MRCRDPLLSFFWYNIKKTITKRGNMIQAIIFDLDGVIVDTEYINFQLQREFIERISPVAPSIDATALSTLVGRSYGHLVQGVKDLSASDLSLAEISEQLEEFAKEYDQQVDYPSLFRSDIVAILEYAKDRNIKLAVASSSRKEHIEEVLESCEILPYFDTLVSGKVFTESKPNPAIYLATLAKLGIPAQYAVAIEDSAFGISSAKAAGVRVIAYEEKRMPIDQTQADYCEKDMRGILKRLRLLA